MDEVHGFVWDEAKRLLARQEANVDGLRIRALGLLTAGGVIAALFAGHAKYHGWQDWPIGVAVAAFCVMAGLALWVQLPQKFTFSHDLESWVGNMRRGEVVPISEAASNLSRDLNDYRKANRPKVQRIATAVTLMSHC